MTAARNERREKRYTCGKGRREKERWDEVEEEEEKRKKTLRIQLDKGVAPTVLGCWGWLELKALLHVLLGGSYGVGESTGGSDQQRGTHGIHHTT